MISSTIAETYKFMSSSHILPTVIPSEKVAVVTGANTGIGFGIVKELCEQFDGYIYLTARNKTRGEEALRILKSMNVCKNPDKLRFHELDILNEDHIENFMFEMRDTHRGIDILINNAGIAYKRKSTVPFAEQAEKTILTNYVALVHLCTFLFPLLRTHGRVVNLSSAAGHLSAISHYKLKSRLMDEHLTEKQLTDIMYEFMDLTKVHPKAHVEAGWPDSAYAVSKIGVNLLTRIFQRKLDCDGHVDRVINAVHPGYIATNMSSYMGNANIYEGAKAPVWCALLPPNIVAPRGEFVWNDCSIVDIDSPTTPARPDDIMEYDIVDLTDFPHIYKSTTDYPPFGEVLRQEREEYEREKLRNATKA